MNGEGRRLVERCRRYWFEAGLSRKMIESMTTELESHLVEASRDGRDPQSVIGEDTAGFAAAWAAELRPSSRGRLTSWKEIERKLDPRSSSRVLGWFSGVVVVVVGVVTILTWGRESAMDSDMMRWVWTGLALVMGLGEIFTAGFFLLPFGIGAGLAAVAAWFNLHYAVQTVLFFGGTGLAMLYLRRFIRSQDEDDGLVIGPERYVGMQALVLETVNTRSNSGLVRVEAEQWRAITDGDPIVEGATVEVVALRGNRLVVSEVS